MHAHTSQLPAHVCGAFKPVFGGNVCRVCVYVVYFVYFVYVVNFRNVGTHLNIFTDIVLGLLVAPSDFLLVFAVTVHIVCYQITCCLTVLLEDSTILLGVACMLH